MLEVVRIPVLTDNYIWLLGETETGEAVAVDPAEAVPVLAAAAARGWRIGQVWNTHWHRDHTGGDADLKAATGCAISGPAEAAKVAPVDRIVGEGDRVALGPHEAEVWAVPGHTAGHVAYHLPAAGMMFVGDTLFAMGCGRLFEGDAAQMWRNMARLAALPAATRVYCAHEYTLANGRFARAAEPDNAEIAARVAEVEAARARGEATVPTTIALERATNPFLRAGDAGELGRRRAAKDAFAG